MIKRRLVTAKAQAQMLLAMSSGSCTYAELTEISGQTYQTVANWLKELRGVRLVHVCAWDADTRGYATVPRFAWAVGRTDLPRPSMPANVRAQLVRDKRKAGEK